MTSLLRPVFFTASTTRRSSQELMKVRSMGFWLGKDRLDLLEDLAAARRADRRQNRRDPERLRHLGERRDVVDDDAISDPSAGALNL
jgi:hypothetical protein